MNQSNYPWEREAQDFVRDGLPDMEPYRAWANVEFVALDGSMNEVDLLVLCPSGFFLIEIKSRPGRLAGDMTTWTWRFEKRDFTVDNPLFLANMKAKRLKELLLRQNQVSPRDFPFIAPAVFVSAPDLAVQLTDDARTHVYGRDAKDSKDGKAPSGLPGIVGTLLSSPAARGFSRPPVDGSIARALSRAVDGAGIRPTQKSRRVGDYVLQRLIFEGNLFQEWQATHRTVPDLKRRIRIYQAAASSGIPRETVARAARRELDLLKTADHPGILRVLDYVDHDLGPALLFDSAEGSMRLDHYLKERESALTVDLRLHLLRSVADTLRFAHGKGLFHRALSPQSLLVVDPKAERPAVKVFNWQTGVREASSTSSLGVTGTDHLERLVDDAASVYMAPEALISREAEAEVVDVFSLGALAFRLFAGRAPAASFSDLRAHLEQNGGLALSSVVDAVPETLQVLVREATDPDVTKRLGSVEEFLKCLDEVENELTRPADDSVADPAAAGMGDRLQGGYLVKRKLGTGSTAMAFLVERDGREKVLKLALTPEHRSRLEAEAEVLSQLSHPGIVGYHGKVEMYGRVGILVDLAGEKSLAARRREEGSLSLDQLQRWGGDLLQAVSYLEQKGIPHRDIKPDNLGIAKGSDGALHLVLFDFSLSRAPLDAFQAGTRPYLEPFLVNRKPRKWDLAAERYAVAATLFEMATGDVPKWGDGISDAATLKCEATVDAEAFDPAVREPLAAFFTRALRRSPKDRFDNAQEMLWAWGRAFEAADRPVIQPAGPSTADPAALLAAAALDSPVATLPLSARAVNALERSRVTTVAELLARPLGRLLHLKGAGKETRREIGDAWRRLRVRFPETLPDSEDGPRPAEALAEPQVPLVDTIDGLYQQIAQRKFGKGATSEPKLHALFLGLDTVPGLDPALPPSQADLARALNIHQPQVSVTLGRFRDRWSRNPNLTRLREEIRVILAGLGGVASVGELENALLAARGSELPDAIRTQAVRAVLRAALETERGQKEPSWLQHRADGVLLLAPSDQLAEWAEKLGRKADQLSQADPLSSPVRALEALQAIRPPKEKDKEPSPLPAERLVRLAAAASRSAAVSSRLEIYPRGLPAARALKLASGTVQGTGTFTPEEVRSRVASRYPEAEPLPDRPALDALLEGAGLELRWDGSALAGRGAFIPPLPTFEGVSSATRSANVFPRPPAPSVPSVEDPAAEFDEKLAKAVRDGGYLVLTVAERDLADAEAALASRFGLTVTSLERLLLGAMKEVAASHGASWATVLKADANPAEPRLRALVRQAIPKVEEQITARERPVLLTYPGLLVRYEQLDLLDRLRDRATRPDGGLKGAWVLVPASDQDERPFLDGTALTVLTPNQWTRIPTAWLEARASFVPLTDGVN